MKRKFVYFLMVCILAACGPSPAPGRTLTYPQEYNNGHWDQCIVNIVLYSDNDSLTSDQAIHNCEILYQKWLSDPQPVYLPFPKLPEDFGSLQEYEYYLGTWDRCWIDVVTYGKKDITDQERLGFCSSALDSSIAKNQRENQKMPPPPTPLPKTQG